MRLTGNVANDNISLEDNTEIELIYNKSTIQYKQQNERSNQKTTADTKVIDKLRI